MCGVNHCRFVLLTHAPLLLLLLLLLSSRFIRSVMFVLVAMSLVGLRNAFMAQSSTSLGAFHEQVSEWRCLGSSRDVFTIGLKHHPISMKDCKSCRCVRAEHLSSTRDRLVVVFTSICVFTCMFDIFDRRYRDSTTALTFQARAN